MYINKVQNNSAAEELDSLFAECAIVEAIPLQPRISLQHKIDDHPMNLILEERPFLLRQGERRSCLMRSRTGAASSVCGVGVSLTIITSRNILHSGVVIAEFPSCVLCAFAFYLCFLACRLIHGKFIAPLCCILTVHLE
ncbi:hypothetical protein PHJA_002313400 [Phtheirospermum japonicum]|uniref:Uncharacterized protein n=1 Tax=Phtheirospermum japonicum TaxID=374723 RepID=A0A830CZX6_9LAMI|nr:hypothetical protein PHJA_002313400 [Phtheirospermum japonicum]